MRDVDLGTPIRSVLPTAYAPVLTVLARSGTPLTGRAVADLTDPHVSQSHVSQILRALTEDGIVTVTPAGSAYLYAFNRDHLAADAISALVDLRARLWDAIVEHTRTWAHQPDGLIVYGSAARGDGGSRSDVDLLVVRPDAVPQDDTDWQAGLTGLADAVHRWTGNSAEILDRSPRDLAVMALERQPLLDNIRRDGRALVGRLSAVPAPATAG